MRKLLLVLFLLTACALEEPYPPLPAPPPAPLSSEDVVRLLLAGISEDAVFGSIRTAGISARPTAAEIQKLRLVGASDRLLAALFAAPLVPSRALPYPALPVEAEP